MLGVSSIFDRAVVVSSSSHDQAGATVDGHTARAPNASAAVRLAGIKEVSSAPDVVLMAITCVVVIERKFRDKLRACAR